MAAAAVDQQNMAETVKERGGNLIKDNQFWLKLLLLVSYCGKEALLRILHNQKNGIPRDHKELYQFLKDRKQILERLCSKKVLKKAQMALLLPKTQETDSSMFDVSILKIVIKNFKGLDDKSYLWEIKNIPTDETEFNKLCRNRNDKLIIYLTLLLNERNELMHPQKKIFPFQFKEKWQKIVNILDNLGYRQKEDKRVMDDLLKHSLEDVVKTNENLTEEFIQAQIDVLYQFARDSQHREAEIKSTQIENTAVLGQLQVLWKENKDTVDKLKDEVQCFRRTWSGRRKRIHRDGEKINNLINENYSNLFKVQSFMDNLEDLLKEKQIPEKDIEVLEHEYKQFTESILVSNHRISIFLKEIDAVLPKNRLSSSNEERNIQIIGHLEIPDSQGTDMNTVIQQIQNIEELKIRCNQPRDECQIIIKEMDLRQSRQNLQQSEVEKLVQNFHLKSEKPRLLQLLDLSECNLNDENIIKFSSIMPFIKTVKLCDNQNISVKGWSSVAQAFMKNKERATLEKLDLSGINFTSTDIKPIFNIFPHVKDISMNSNSHIDLQAWKILLSELKKYEGNIKLSSIHISGEPLRKYQHSTLLPLLRWVPYIHFPSTKFHLNLLSDYLKKLPHAWKTFGIAIKELQYKDCIVSLNDFKVIYDMIECEKMMKLDDENISIMNNQEFLKIENNQIIWNLSTVSTSLSVAIQDTNEVTDATTENCLANTLFEKPGKESTV